jgi:gliding motility-associated-like protein
MKKYCFLITLMLGGHLLLGQSMEITNATTPPFDPQNLISSVFLGEGVEIKSITFSGSAQSVGYFSKGLPFVGIERGIVMTTGLAVSANNTTAIGAEANASELAAAANNSVAFDQDLANQASDTIQDVAVYDIVFVPTADTLRFDYVFASEEYPEFGCSPFNDVFGFFIQGPGYPTPTNIALIPGTNLPVAINNLHPENIFAGVPCPALNEQYYIDRLVSFPFPQPVYDGMTTVLTAIAVVQPCEEYHIKLAIADVLDQSYDSGVFLAAKSFGTGSLSVEVITASPEGVLAEGCAPGTLTFRLPSATQKPFIIDYNIFGNAINGVDYQTIATNLSIPPGQTSVSVPVVALSDAFAEGEEFIGIDVRRDPCTRDTFIIRIRENPLVAPMLPADTTLCLPATPLLLDATVQVPLPDPPSFSNTQELPIEPTNTALFSNINVNGVVPEILGSTTLRSVCVHVEHPWIDDIDLLLISPGGQFLELSTDNGQNGDNYTNTCFTPTATTPINFPLPSAPASAAPFTGNWLPEGDFADLWDGSYPANGNWRLRLIDDTNGQDGALKDWTITFEPFYKIEYQWSPISGLSCPSCPVTDALPTQPTLYTVQVSDSYGCTVTDSIRIDPASPLAAPEIICSNPGLNSVTFTWLSVAGAAGYVVNVGGQGWAPVGTDTFFVVSGLTTPFTNVQIAVQAVPGTPNCGASVGTATCINCSAPTVTAVADSADCFGSNNGVVQVLANGAILPITFSTGSQSNSTGLFSGLGAGVYAVEVVDAQACPQSIFVTVGQPDSLSVAVNMVQPLECHGDTNVQLSALVAGGNGGFSLLWSNGQTGSNADNFSAGFASVTATDAKGCTGADTVLLTQPDELSLSVSLVADILCFGDSTGALNTVVAGGATPYKYAWSSGQTDSNLTNLMAGTYAVTVTDNNGCVDSALVVLPALTPLAVNIVVQNATCALSTTGSINALVSGGVQPYEYLWSGAGTQSVPNLTGLGTGNYMLLVNDANGCTAQANAFVGEPLPMVVNLEPEENKCSGSTDGSMRSTIQGGTAPYQYVWNTGAKNSDIDSIGEGSYTLTVTDANNCTVSATATITALNPIVLQTNVTPVLCHGEATGNIVLTASGGAGGYNIQWIGPGGATYNGAALNNLPAGNYAYRLTDAVGCFLEDNILVNQPGTPVLNDTPLLPDTLCFEAQNGVLNPNISGGTPPYTYQWNTGNNSPALEQLGPGIYLLTVTDANGCPLLDTAAIVQKGQMRIDLTAQDATCFFERDGQASATAVFYGQTPVQLNLLQFSWNTQPAQTGAVAQGLLGGQLFRVTATDADGCSATNSIAVGRREAIVVAVADLRSVSCPGESDGRVVVGSSGGTAPYWYSWSPQPSAVQDSLATGLRAGKYSVVATDAKGCTASLSVEMLEPAKLKSNVKVFDVSCYGDSTGALLAAPQGGTKPYAYQWSNGSTQQGADNLPAGRYALTLSDSRGCTLVDSSRVSQPLTALDATVGATMPKCFGAKNGSLHIQANGGTPPYVYALNNKPFNGSPIQIALGAGDYAPKIVDKKGCLLELPLVLLAQPDPFSVDLGPDFSILLGRDTQLFAQVVNNQGKTTYDWQAADAPWLSCLDCPDPLVEQLEYERYFTVDVSDSAGCRAEDQVRIQVLKPRKVFVPTGFSPNGDGNNDLLLLHGQSNTRVLSFALYDRWGEQVYQGRDFLLNDPAQGWDGQFQGKPCDPGVFVWVLEVEYSDGVKDLYKGNTTLVR